METASWSKNGVTGNWRGPLERISRLVRQEGLTVQGGIEGCLALTHQSLCRLAGFAGKFDRPPRVGFVEQIPRSQQGVFIAVGNRDVNVRAEFPRQGNQPLRLRPDGLGKPALLQRPVQGCARVVSPRHWPY